MKRSFKKINSLFFSLLLVLLIGTNALAAPNTAAAAKIAEKAAVVTTQATTKTAAKADKAAAKTDKTAAKRLAAPAAKAEPVSQTCVKVSWKGVSGADGYCISMKTGKNWKTVGTYKSTTRWVRLHGLKAGTAYNFRVCAYTKTTKGNVMGSYSKTVKVTTTAPAKKDPKTDKPAVTKPAAPAAKAETVSHECIKVSWKGVKNANGYRIYVKTANGWKSTGTYKPTTRWVKLHNLKPNTTYTFKVRAYTNVDNNKVWGSYSKAVTAVTAKNKK
ncbi:MAG: fibronectin type III domain-containing protein [Lachnospiraceae bacterium]|nr:fibronectin type III domain-containing protein [Lachnospiraceae bacterium]